MKHSVEDLIAIAYRYFPRGIRSSEPRYLETEEYRRRFTARVAAGAAQDAWRAMLRRIAERFPAEQYPQVMVENRSIFLQSPTAGPSDRGFSGVLSLPVRGATEQHHELSFLVSFVAPYYFVSSNCLVRRDANDLDRGCDRTTSFDLSADELPFAKGIVEEIEAAFPEYLPLPPHVGQVIVPEASGLHDLGETTLFDCLFTDQR